MKNDIFRFLLSKQNWFRPGTLLDFVLNRLASKSGLWHLFLWMRDRNEVLRNLLILNLLLTFKNCDASAYYIAFCGSFSWIATNSRKLPYHVNMNNHVMTPEVNPLSTNVPLMNKPGIRFLLVSLKTQTSLFHRCFSNILPVKPTTWFIHKCNIARKWVKKHWKFDKTFCVIYLFWWQSCYIWWIWTIVFCTADLQKLLKISFSQKFRAVRYFLLALQIWLKQSHNGGFSNFPLSSAEDVTFSTRIWKSLMGPDYISQQLWRNTVIPWKVISSFLISFMIWSIFLLMIYFSTKLV